jgi:long-chain acyl-CoA synthetase
MTFTDYIFEFSSKLKKVAVIDKINIDYEELYLRIRKISNMIKSKGLGKEDKILLISENSTFFIENYFGIIKSGCVCVPINPRASIEDIEYIINRCEAKLIFVEKRFLDTLTEELSKNLEIFTEETIDDFLTAITILELVEDETKVDFKEDVAVILFTSGSTAKPKGVMLTHYNLSYNTNSIIKYLKLSNNDRIEVVLPFYYCFGTSLLHTHFRVGGSLVINNRFMFPNSVLEDINQYQCTGFAGVPSNYQILLRKSNMKNMTFPTLRYVTQAGGKLPNIFIQELKELLKGTEIYIMYGQTEATARLSYLPPDKLEEKLGSIGKGIPGTQLRILDEDDNEVNTDEVGELVATGGNIMKGYFKDQEETNKVLKKHDLYTGDLATKDSEGYIYILSRKKNIIKSGGNRISPKEIEDIIVEIPGVIETLVIAVNDDILGEAIKAFVVIKPSSLEINEKFIIKYCKNKLPSYKVPKYVEFLEELPKNSSGKVMAGELNDR